MPNLTICHVLIDGADAEVANLTQMSKHKLLKAEWLLLFLRCIVADLLLQ